MKHQISFPLEGEARWGVTFDVKMKPPIQLPPQGGKSLYAALLTILSLFFIGACGGAPQPKEELPLVVSGFTSRETVSEEPVFDLKASQAMMRQSSTSPVAMNIQDVRFTLFRAGRKSAIVSADTGLFHPTDKTVELQGRVVYNAFDDSFHVQAEKMAWDPAASILSCETGVEGFFRSFQFTATRLDISRSRNILQFHHSTFVGPG